MLFLPLQAVGDQPRAAHTTVEKVRRYASPSQYEPLLNDSFGESASNPGAWLATGEACLTAGTSSTPSTSIPSCGTSAAQDAAGSGALQLTASQTESVGMVVYQTPLPTANGLQITFSYSAFNGSNPPADGMTSFLTDASQPMPAAAGKDGSSLAYAGAPGIANAYLGIGYDTYGDFSQANSKQSGGPGPTPNTIVLRGIAGAKYPYLGGYQSGGAAASLPFSLDAPTATSRSATPPTIQETLTSSGQLTIAIDTHNGAGLTTYLSESIVGVNGQSAVPANVYLGFTAATGGKNEQHQITDLTVTNLISPPTNAPTPLPSGSPIATPLPTPTAVPTPSPTPSPTPTATPVPIATVVNDAFSETSTTAGEWLWSGSACLTAGTSTTPTSSIPGCGLASPDPVGQGALQLTPSSANAQGFVISSAAIPTSGGLHVTFSDNAFGGTSPGGNGVVLFLTDASQPMPQVPGSSAGGLGYGNVSGGGLQSAYLGIAFDEAGAFSNPTSGSGGPGTVPETIAIRGAASANYPYLGGYVNSKGVAASLPAPIDQPTATSRPFNPPTFDVVLSPSGHLAVSIDYHDGHGLLPYFSHTTVGRGGQPVLPANVFVGLAATTATSYETHQITGFSIGPAATTVPPSTVFAPTNIANLQAWYDISNLASLTLATATPTAAASASPAASPSGTGTMVVAAVNDLSGNGNSLAQSNASLSPVFVANGIDGHPSMAFSGANYLIGSNPAFSTDLFNESTVFYVTNETTYNQSSSVGSTGVSNGNPRWDLRLTEGGVTHFDFNSSTNGRLTTNEVATGYGIWTTAGSISQHAQFIRKNGNTLASTTLAAASVSGNYPFVVGANLGSNAAYEYTGQIGEILVYNRFLATSEMASVEGYLACKWGLQTRLPANHPYRNTCPQGGPPSYLVPTPTPAPSALQDPVQLRSSNGQLVFNVVASQTSGGSPQLTYNGSSVPPTLRLLPGDTLIVNLTNELPTPPSGSGYLNDTSLHYHGLHVNPNAPGDDSIDLLAMPGQALHYQFTIPLNHPTGLYWYHSHAHGEAERQNLAGMSGALIIDGVSQYAPAVASMPERILIARDVEPSGTALPGANQAQVRAMLWAMQHSSVPKRGPMGSSTRMSMNSFVRGRTNAKTRNPYVTVNRHFRKYVRPYVADTHCTGAETPVLNWTLNGQNTPLIGIRPGEQQFWRFVNAGSDTYLDLQVDNENMQIVSLDGVPLASVGSPALSVSHYVVPPSSRIEFIVTGPPAGTTSYLRTNCFDAGSDGSAMPAAILAQINPTSSLSDEIRLRHRDRISLKAVHAMKRHALHTAAFIRRYAATGGTLRQQTLTYSDQDTINGESYDPGAPAQFYAQAGTMEQWTIVNDSNQVHTFHIHQVHFLVDQIVGGTTIEQSNVGQVLDNINVPASTANGPGSVVLTMDFTDPTIIGTFLLHCHILSHEDMGMMSKITVGTAPPLTTSASNGLTFVSPTAQSQSFTVSGGQAPYSVSGCSSVANASISGSTVTVSPAGAGSCVLTVADSGSLTANIEITVDPPPSAMSASPNSITYSSATAPPRTSAIAGGIPPYAVSGCSGIASATISGSMLTVAPTAAGSCMLVVSDTNSDMTMVSVDVNAPQTGSYLDNLTFHQDTERLGWYRRETQLTTATVGSSQFGLLGRLSAPSGSPAFGKVYAQPLYVSNESIGGVTHNLVMIATSTDQVYAFDDATDTVVWSRSFTNPAAGVTQQSWSSTDCGDVNPDIGIISTPVIDRSTDRMYLVAMTTESGVFHIRLHAISMQNGADVVSPVEVSASAMLATGGTAMTDPEHNFSRSALLEANGNIYVALSSHCDYEPQTVHGWIMSFSAASLAPTGTAVDLTNADPGTSYFLGSIWMSGFGPAADSEGNVYFATGNGAYDGVSDFAMSVMKLPGTLDVSQGSHFTPNAEATQSAADKDLGSAGVMLVPDGISSPYPHMAIAGGKIGVKYVLNRDNLGGQQANDAGAIWSGMTGGYMWGGPAFFQDSNGGAHVIYGNGKPLNTYNLNLTTGALSVLASSTGPSCLECRDGGSQPIVSSNGTQSGSAVVWALQTPTDSGGTISLYAFNAMTMAILYSGPAGDWTMGSGSHNIGGALVSPLVANGRVYVPTDGSVAIFGLTP